MSSVRGLSVSAFGEIGPSLVGENQSVFQQMAKIGDDLRSSLHLWHVVFHWERTFLKPQWTRLFRCGPSYNQPATWYFMNAWKLNLEVDCLVRKTKP